MTFIIEIVGCIFVLLIYAAYIKAHIYLKKNYMLPYVEKHKDNPDNKTLFYQWVFEHDIFILLLVSPLLIGVILFSLLITTIILLAFLSNPYI